eukprot:scaffold8023_cov103-Isochrysis_galbana.AAC.5
MVRGIAASRIPCAGRGSRPEKARLVGGGGQAEYFGGTARRTSSLSCSCPTALEATGSLFWLVT